MDDRKLYILSAILHSYIRSAEPIGSRTLQRDFEMKVSPATIRNEMSDLEHLGYLMKAHASSGRIPSHRAYRWYVDELLARGSLEQAVPALVDTSLLRHSNELESMVEGTLRLLSDRAGLPAFAWIPARRTDRLRRIELIPLSAHELVIVYVYSTKVVRTNVIHLSEPYTEDRMKRTGEVLQQILGERSLEEIEELLDSGLLSGDAVRGNLFSAIGPLIREEIESGLREKLHVEGAAQLFRLPELQDPGRVRKLLREVVDSGTLQQFLAKTPSKMSVYIGEESGLDPLEEMTLVVAPYHARGDLEGRLGILGPTRMEYRKVLSDVGMMSRYLDSVANRG